MTEQQKLPFKLNKDHKRLTKKQWKEQKMIFTETEFEYWYNKIIYATHCSLDKCRKPFITSKDRQLDHNHKTGEIRNIICSKCNHLREDNKLFCTNTSGFKCIHKHICKNCKQGFIWRFKVYIDGKPNNIKSSVNKEWLIEYAKKWFLENDYHT
jgi:hypothetical protein